MRARARTIAVACVLSIACGVSACARMPERDPDQYPIARVDLVREIPTSDPAELTYRTSCLPCHGVDGRGAGAVTGADFTSAEGPLTRPDAELLVSIRQGRRGAIGTMPPHGDILTDEESAAVLAYVRRTFGPDIVVVDPSALDADVDAGADAGPTP